MLSHFKTLILGLMIMVILPFSSQALAQIQAESLVPFDQRPDSMRFDDPRLQELLRKKQEQEELEKRRQESLQNERGQVDEELQVAPLAIPTEQDQIGNLIATLPSQQQQQQQPEKDNAIMRFIFNSGIVSVNIPLIDVHPLKNFFLSGGYHPKVKPAYRQGLWNRYDNYYVNLTPLITTDHRVADFGQAAEADFGLALGLKNDFEVLFTRSFPTAEEATLATPYDPITKLPTTSARLKKLRVGDFVRIKARMALIVSADQLKSLGILSSSVGIGAHFAVMGTYQLQFLKLSKNKIRFRILGVKTNDFGFGASFGPSSGLAIFGLSFVGHGILSLFDIRGFEYNRDPWINQKLNFADYDLDIGNDQVAQAFDQVMDSVLDYNTLSDRFPFLPKNNVNKIIAANIEPLDQLYRGGSLAESQLNRNFKGRATLKEDKAEWGLFSKVVKWINTDIEREIKISSVQKDETEQNYLVNTYTDIEDQGFLFSLFGKKKSELHIDAIAKADENYRNIENPFLIPSHRYQLSTLSQKKLNSILRDISFNLPQGLIEQIDFSNWGDLASTKSGVGIDYKWVLRPELLSGNRSAAGKAYTYKELFYKYWEYLEGIPSLRLEAQDVKGRNDRARKLNRIARRLEKIFNDEVVQEKRLEALVSLSDSRLFLQTGIGFILYLKKDLDIRHLWGFDLQISGKDSAGYVRHIQFNYGNVAVPEPYQTVRVLQSILDGSEVELTRQAEDLRALILAHQLEDIDSINEELPRELSEQVQILLGNKR